MKAQKTDDDVVHSWCCTGSCHWKEFGLLLSALFISYNFTDTDIPNDRNIVKENTVVTLSYVSGLIFVSLGNFYFL